MPMIRSLVSFRTRNQVYVERNGKKLMYADLVKEVESKP